MRKTFCILLLLSLVFCEGCGTLVTHGIGTGKDPEIIEPSDGIYRGIRYDWNLDKDIGKNITQFKGDGCGGYFAAFVLALFIVEHAASTVADTVMLPHDLKQPTEASEVPKVSQSTNTVSSK